MSMKLEQTWPLNSRLVDTDGADGRATTADVAALASSLEDSSMSCRELPPKFVHS